MTNLDYPDYMQNVSRAPTQVLPYQIWQCVSIVDQAVATGATFNHVLNISNAGFHVVIDKVFVTWTMKGPIYVSAETAPNQAVPVWTGIMGGSFYYCAEIIISNQGAFMLDYPASFRVSVINSNSVARLVSTYINYYKYVI